ncbi:adenosylcobinamide-GDP ribazoletransferase [Actinospica sp.]|jgi:adenosylcobinamide-GDP ribazoletransferase|uniref:adenosylcobinamide-GDP ribazoletransferase n=1 Tax=Actinospica sp. TaxID=1872142 RepID=UPI002C48D482|nr:adenosylcobinamide-GDP ribazoletransferase [Actinospica sp.]HWG24562.1 adenosylcobinamide-GDP ribazoletransferase [Actinospica sp.]
MGSWLSGLRLSIGTLSILRVRVDAADRNTAGRAMACAPLVGAGIGVVAAAVGWAARAYTDSTFLAAVAAIATYAGATRALHLDGLADVADGLGSAKPREQALEIMKRSDIGPFGVVTLLLVLALQIAAITSAYAHHRGGLAIIVAAISGRLAVTLACTPRVPSARPDGLGAWVAGSVPIRGAALVSAACIAACFGLGYIRGLGDALLAAAACAIGVAGAILLLRRCVTRFGGITGDVLGALVETAAAAALLVMAVR